MDWSSCTSIGLVFILTFLSILKMGGFWNNHRRKNFPPGPRALSIIANLHLFDLKIPYRTYLQLSKAYGLVFSVQMGQRKIVVISGYDTVKEVLVNQADAFAGRPKVPVSEDLTRGNIRLGFAHSENWKVMRKFTLTTLGFGMGKRAIEDCIVEENGYLADAIGSQEGKPLDASKIINAGVANIIVSLLLGKFSYKDSRSVRLLHLSSESMRLAGKPLVTMYNIFPHLGFLLRANNLLLNRDELHAYVQVTFVEHLKTLDKNDQRRFIGFLVKQQELPTTEEAAPTDFLMAVLHFVPGWRICAGETLAKIELFLFFTSLLQRFTFHPTPGVSISDLDLSPAISFNVIPKPYKMCCNKFLKL
ncbi:LOW QUALITY PROTEIN: cytochrome P450 2K1-like [Morus bassanus]